MQHRHFRTIKIRDLGRLYHSKFSSPQLIEISPFKARFLFRRVDDSRQIVSATPRLTVKKDTRKKILNIRKYKA